jgi:2-hydroxy-6-oxonona-2,4-dienedioate hydrolase
MSSIWIDLLNAETIFFNVNGIRTRVITAGDGPPIVLLHGSGGHAEAYARNIVPLSKNHRVIAMDYLGSGLTGYPAASPSLNDHVTHIVGLLDAMGLDKVCLAGESFGGTLAFAVARAHPHRLSSLISIVGGSFDVGMAESSAEQYATAVVRLVERQRAFLANPSKETVRQRVAWLFHKPERDVTEELVDLRWALYQLESNRRSVADMTEMILQDQAARQNRTPHDKRTDALKPLRPDELGAMTLPTLFIWSAHNPTTSAHTARVAAGYMPNAKFELMEDCGHWPQWEDPQTFNRLIGDFVDSVASSTLNPNCESTV